MLEDKGEKVSPGANRKQDRIAPGNITAGRKAVEQPPSQNRKEDTKARAGHAAQSDHRRDGAFGEHVGRRREQISRPSLMRGTGETDQKDGLPISDVFHENNGHYAAGKKEHAGFPGATGRPAGFDESGDTPATGDTQDRRETVDRRQHEPAVFDIEMAGFFEEIR